MRYKLDRAYKTGWVDYQITWDTKGCIWINVLNFLLLQFFFIRLFKAEINAVSEGKRINKTIYKIDGFVIPFTGFFFKPLYIWQIPCRINGLKEKEWRK